MKMKTEIRAILGADELNKKNLDRRKNMERLLKFPVVGELTGRNFEGINNSVVEGVQKGYTLRHADNALTVQNTPIEKMAVTVDEDMDEYDRAVGNATPTLQGRNPMAYRKSMRITNQNGQTIFAYIEEDEEASRKICFCQQYSDGTFSRTLTISQADVVTIIMAGDGSDIFTQSRAEKIGVKFGLKYGNTFSGTREDVISIRDIAEMIAGELQNIPVYRDDLTEVERVEFYQRLIGMIKGMTSQMLNDHKAYYPLSTEDLEYLARNMEMTKVKFLKHLKKYDMLYLTTSSKGYQTNVRLNGTGKDSFTTWRYCVIRDEELENDEDYVCDCDF